MNKRRLVFFVILVLISFLYISGCRRAGRWLVKDDVPAHADAMVILMGNFPERVLQATDLFHRGIAGRVIIVEESMGAYRALEERGVSVTGRTEQARDALVKMGVPGENITILPGDARSTLTEAIIVRDYLSTRPDTDTLILVSSPPHMRRAGMIFRKATAGSEWPVYITCSPSAWSDFNAGRWWREKEDIQDVLSEYLKIVSFRLIEKRKLKD
jgi:uncharacterized SAM-binding protein YcdF (DUF218 family)